VRDGVAVLDAAEAIAGDHENATGRRPERAEVRAATDRAASELRTVSMRVRSMCNWACPRAFLDVLARNWFCPFVLRSLRVPFQRLSSTHFLADNRRWGYNRALMAGNLWVGGRDESANAGRRSSESKARSICCLAGVDADGTNAIEELRVPQVASVLFVRSIGARPLRRFAEALATLRPLPPLKEIPLETYTVDPKLRDRMASLLGKDAGARLVDWLDLYDTAIAHAPTPLSDKQKHDTDRVVMCFWRYFTVQDEWVKARAAAARAAADHELRKRGMGKQVEALYRFARRVAAGEPVEDPKEDSDLGKACVLWVDVRMKAYDRFSVPQPDWDVPTTDSLEREVQAFANRVADAMKRGP
jgi:hypothetical protein